MESYRFIHRLCPKAQQVERSTEKVEAQTEVFLMVKMYMSVP